MEDFEKADSSAGNQHSSEMREEENVDQSVRDESIESPLESSHYMEEDIHFSDGATGDKKDSDSDENEESYVGPPKFATQTSLSEIAEMDPELYGLRRSGRSNRKKVCGKYLVVICRVTGFSYLTMMNQKNTPPKKEEFNQVFVNFIT